GAAPPLAPTGWSRMVRFRGSGPPSHYPGTTREDEAVVCYDLLSGAPLWSHAYPAHFQSPLAGEGPRATPTVAGQRVYTLGSTGVLNCLDLETGRPLWSKDILRDNEAKVN